jgi:hypothetical protein
MQKVSYMLLLSKYIPNKERSLTEDDNRSCKIYAMREYAVYIFSPGMHFSFGH